MFESNISNIHKNRIIESRNASFFEHVFPCKVKEDSSFNKQTRKAIIEDSKEQEQEKVQIVNKSFVLSLDIVKELERKIIWSIFFFIFSIESEL